MRKLLLLSLFAVSIAAKAQVKTLTLKDALVYALENKADAKKAKLQVENSEYKIEEIRALAMPQITLNSNLTYNPVIQKSLVDGAMFGQPGTKVPISFGQRWVSNTGVSLSQTIFDQTV